MKKKWLSVFLAICLMFSLVPVLSGTAEAANAQDTQFSKILNPSAPSGYDASSTEDPYMKGENHPFLLSEQDEALLYLQYNGDKRGTVQQSVGDTFKAGTVDNSSTKCAGQPRQVTTTNYASTNTLSSGPVTKEGLSTGMAYVTTVSFDPTGSGRRDHVAYVDYDVDSKKIETWVMDAKDGSYSSLVALSGEIDSKWIQLNQYTYGAFFSITAGDYDGDGKDTYVVYCPGGKSINPHLYEFSLVNGAYSQKTDIDVVAAGLYNEKSMTTQAPIAYSSDGSKSYIQMLTMSLATGDFDGDGVEELGTAVGTFRLCGDSPNAIRGQWGEKATYTTQVCVMDEESGAFTRTASFDLADKTAETDSSTTYRMLYAGQIAAGDVDADGSDEIVVAGFTGTATVTDTFKWSNLYERDGSNYATATISCENGAYGRTTLATTAMNGFTKAHTDNNKSTWPVPAIACVSIDGDSAAADVFLSGTLYSDTTGMLVSVYQPGFFNEKDDLSVISVQDHWVDSVAVGNFDGNSAGRQQVMFTICEKDKDKNNYLYKVGILGGDTYSDVYSNGSLVSYGTVEDYYYNNLNSNDSKLYDGGRGNAWWDDSNLVLNCVPVAIDNDNDGVVAKYAGKGWVYTDPSILAVLQAAPYFSELGSYSDFGGTTSYSVTTGYTYGKTSSDNVSFGFGFAGDFQAGPVAISVEAGYTLNWSKSFEDSLTTSYTTTFTAGPYDQVIVQRTPAVVYSYQIQKADGSYDSSNYYQFTVPLKPVYTKLSVDEYNNFVDYYANWYKTNVTDNDSISSSVKDSSVLLKKLDSANPVLPDGNEGNPSAYRSSWTPKIIGTSSVSDNAMSLSKGEYTLDHSGGSTTSDWSVQSDSTKSITTNHGFHFSLTLQGGVKDVYAVGGYANLDYNHGSGYYHTTTNAAEASGTVGDIDGPALEAKGIPENISGVYGFTWSFGKWEGDLGGTCLNNGVRDASKNSLFDGNVPFFGYAVSSISRPPTPVTTLKAKLASASTAVLTWTAPAVSGSIEGYNVYQVKNGTYTQLNGDVLTNTTYTTGLDKSDQDYSFVVTMVTADGESVWSNVATVTTPKQYYTLTMTGQVSASAGYQGVSVSSGGKCPENTIVHISAKALDGYALTGYQINNDTKVTFDPCETKDLNFNFPSQNTTVAFTTQQVSSDIAFAPNDSSKGSVTGTVGGTSLEGDSTVTDVVVLHAVSKKGSALTGWTVTEKDDSGRIIGTTTISDDGSGTLTLNPVKPGYSITANFEDANTVQKTVTVNVPQHGSIRITDNNDTVLTPNASHQIKVALNSSLKFQAVPAELYTFKGWTDDLAGTVNPQIVTVSKDMTVGANFNAPVLCKLTVVQPTEGGTLSAVSGGVDVTSGSQLPSGSTVSLTVTKNTGYALDHWLVNGETVQNAETMNLTLRKNTSVSAVLAQTYQIAATAGAGGTITPSGASTVTLGGSLSYQITPDSGYKITDVLVDGVSVGAQTLYEFSGVKADHTITASFEKVNSSVVQRTVTVIPPTGGSIQIKDSAGKVLTPNASHQIKADLNSRLTFAAVPMESYTFKGWTDDLTGTANPQIVTVKANMTVGADFSAPVVYKVTYSAGTGGTVSAKNGSTSVASDSLVASDSALSFSAVPSAGYIFGGWTVNGSADPAASDSLTLPITKATTVTAKFIRIYTITASAGEGGTITPSGASTVKQGDAQSYKVSPNTGYKITDVLVDGTSVGAQNLYEFSEVKADHTITASFEKISNSGDTTGGTTGDTTGGTTGDTTGGTTVDTAGGTTDGTTGESKSVNTSAQTGDTSNVSLWVAVFLISGGIAAALGIYSWDCKKRREQNEH